MSLGYIDGVQSSVPSSNQGAVINVAGVPMVWDGMAGMYIPAPVSDQEANSRLTSLQRIATGVPSVIVGSSTSARCFVVGRPTDSPQETNNGYFGNLQQMHGSPFSLVRGGALGLTGTVTGPLATADSCLAQIQAAISLPGGATDLIFQGRGNDDFSTVSVTQFTRWLEQGIQMWLGAGRLRVWLIKQHLKTADAALIATYRASNDAMDLLAERYKGRVYTVDHFSALLAADGLGTDPALLLDGTHMNTAGARKCALAWDGPLRAAGLIPSTPYPIDPYAYGTSAILSLNPLMQADATGAYDGAGWAGSSAAVVQGSDDPWGRKTFRVTQSAANTLGFATQNYTPSGAQCVGRAVMAFRPLTDSVGLVGVRVRNNASTWLVDLMSNVLFDTSNAKYEKDRWYHYASAPFLVPTAFFAANSRFSACINSVAGATVPAAMEMSGCGLIKVADAFPT